MNKKRKIAYPGIILMQISKTRLNVALFTEICLYDTIS